MSEQLDNTGQDTLLRVRKPLLLEPQYIKLF